MFTLADVVHFLTNQFTRLCAGTLSLSCIFPWLAQSPVYRA